MIEYQEIAGLSRALVSRVGYRRRRWIDKDDVAQEAAMKLVELSQSRPDLPSGHARRDAYWHAKTAFRRLTGEGDGPRRRMERGVSLDDPISPDARATRLALTASRDWDSILREDREELMTLARRLPSSVAPGDWIVRRLCEGVEMSEIAQWLGVTEHRAEIWARPARAALRALWLRERAA